MRYWLTRLKKYVGVKKVKTVVPKVARAHQPAHTVKVREKKRQMKLTLHP